MNGRRPAEDAADGESESKKARITIELSDDEPEENEVGRPSEGASVIPGLNGQLGDGNDAADIPSTLLQDKGKGRQLDLDGTSSTTGPILNGGTETQNAEAGPSTADAAISTTPTNPPPSPPLPKSKDPAAAKGTNTEAAVNPTPSSSSAETILDLFRQDFLDRETTKEHVLALEGDDMKTIVRKKVNVLKCLHFGRPLAPLLGIDSDDLMTDSESENEEDLERAFESMRKEVREVNRKAGEERKTGRMKEKMEDQNQERRQKQTQETTQEQKNEQAHEHTNEKTNGKTSDREKGQTGELAQGSISLEKQVRGEVKQTQEPAQGSISLEEQVRGEVKQTQEPAQGSISLEEQVRGKVKQTQEPAQGSISLEEQVREEAELRAMEGMSSAQIRAFLRWKDRTLELPPFDPIKDRRREAKETDKDLKPKRARKLVAINRLYRAAPGTYDLANLEWFEATHTQFRFELSALVGFLLIEESLIKRRLAAEEQKKANLERARAAAERQKKLDMDRLARAAAATATASTSASKATSTSSAHSERPKEGTEEEQKELLALQTLGIASRDAERSARRRYIDLRKRSARADGVIGELFQVKHEKVWGSED